MGCVRARQQASSEPSYGMQVSEEACLPFVLAEIRGERLNIRELGYAYSESGGACSVGHPLLGRAWLYACRQGDSFGCAAMAIRVPYRWLPGLVELCHSEALPIPVDSLATLLLRIPTNERICPTRDLDTERALFLGASMALQAGNAALADFAVHRALGVRPNTAIRRNLELLRAIPLLIPLVEAKRRDGTRHPRLTGLPLEQMPRAYLGPWNDNHDWQLFDPVRIRAIRSDIDALAESLDMIPENCDLPSLRRHIHRLPKAALMVGFRKLGKGEDGSTDHASVAVVQDQQTRSAYCEVADRHGELWCARRGNVPEVSRLFEEYRANLGDAPDGDCDAVFVL